MFALAFLENMRSDGVNDIYVTLCNTFTTNKHIAFRIIVSKLAVRSLVFNFVSRGFT